MVKNIIIVGAGGFGREVYKWVTDSLNMDQYTIKGFLSKNSGNLENYNISVPILGHEDTYEIQSDDVFVVAIGNIAIKRMIVEKLKSKNAEFLTLIHPTAVVSANSVIGEGVVICPYCVVTDGAVIGKFAMLNIYVCCGHDSKVGDYCVLSPYATLNGYAQLHDCVFMATRSTITGNMTVGAHSIIGAHSLVLHNVPQNSKILGVSKQSPQKKKD